ncbi:MAG TPA: 50S ribosomal protein L13 [Alphaproteobacteria bacterium]|jgi:large subunit ribosomal protein L13|nr:50S ribosomal protein L13 [Alphaproteobacteria bacterium]
MKTYSATAKDVVKKWYVVDAENVVLGRLASAIALRLRGKHKPIYTPHVDCGDNIIVINAGKVRLTGRKVEDKTYHWHTGYPGGIRSRTAGKVLSGTHPERVVVKAIERMIPRSPMGRRQMSNLRVYAGTDHPHGAQNPEPLDIGALNPKNRRSV